MSMTGYERVRATLDRKPVDRISYRISPWGDTWKKWTKEGHVKPGEDIADHFNFDARDTGWIDGVANLDFENVILEETEETILILDGNGAKLRRHKQHDTTPEHVDFTVKDRKSWEEYKPFFQKLDTRRYNSEDYIDKRTKAKNEDRFVFWAGIAQFEMMHGMTGHENLLMGMALDPDWIRDMVKTLGESLIMHMEELFSKGGKPDGFFAHEDLGFKFKPFMSSAMYKELLQPGHKMVCDYAHSLGCPVVMHSCGYVETLVDGLIEAGINCLQSMEVKAGMDLPKLFDQFGDRIAFHGGIDARVLEANDRAQIDKEMEKIDYVLKNGGSYILHSDHSESPKVEHETVLYFIERGLEISKKYCKL